MNISFTDARLADEMNSFAKLSRMYGAAIAKTITRRLAQLRAAAVLAEMQVGNCHPLKGDREGTFAVSVGKGYRLLFAPADEPVPRHPDGGIASAAVTALVIIGVEDYHG